MKHIFIRNFIYTLFIGIGIIFAIHPKPTVITKFPSINRNKIVYYKNKGKKINFKPYLL